MNYKLSKMNDRRIPLILYPKILLMIEYIYSLTHSIYIRISLNPSSKFNDICISWLGMKTKSAFGQTSLVSYY